MEKLRQNVPAHFLPHTTPFATNNEKPNRKIVFNLLPVPQSRDPGMSHCSIVSDQARGLS